MGVVSSVVNAVGDFVGGVGDTVSNVIDKAVENPLEAAALAAAAYYGGSALLGDAAAGDVAAEAAASDLPTIEIADQAAIPTVIAGEDAASKAAQAVVSGGLYDASGAPLTAGLTGSQLLQGANLAKSLLGGNVNPLQSGAQSGGNSSGINRKGVDYSQILGLLTVKSPYRSVSGLLR